MIDIHMFVMSVCLIFTKEEAGGLCCGTEEHRRGDRSNNSANLLVVSLCWLDLVTLVGLDHDEDVIHANSQNLREKGNFFCQNLTRKGMISKMISVAGIPIKPKIPIEAKTESKTIITPKRPRVILLSMKNPLNENFPY